MLIFTTPQFLRGFLLQFFLMAMINGIFESHYTLSVHACYIVIIPYPNPSAAIPGKQ